MNITALAPWFGSKRTLASRIVAQLGKHRCYFEPFCGSMAVLLAKPEVSHETVNDLHGDIINLALVIRHQKWGPWLYRQLRRTLVHEEMYRIGKARLGSQQWTPHPEAVEEKDAERAYWFFVASWLGRNGVIGTKQSNNGFSVRYTADGGIHGTRFQSAVQSIPAWRRRLREVTILLLEKIEDEAGTAIYVDPPYLSKGATYVHDFTPDQHVQLAALLQRFRRARVVVSYYADPRLEQLYPGWSSLVRWRSHS